MRIKSQFRAAGARSGFTFLEIMLVVVIIGILAGLVGPRLVGRSREAKVSAAKIQLQNFKTSLMGYEMQIGNFPSSSEGLQALVSKPSSVDGDAWKKQMDNIPLDPWGKPYQYACPSEHNMDFDVSSGGPDGQMGTADDVTNWQSTEGDKKL